MKLKFHKTFGCQLFTSGFLMALLLGVCQMTAWAGDSQSLEFTRLKGKPTLMEKTLTVVPGTFELVATTGMGGVKDGIFGVSSADVFVNGVQIWSENDFKPPFTRLSKTVTLKASNVIGVKINGKPGSWISLGFGSAPVATIGFSTAISSKTEGQPASVTVALSAANTNVVSVGYTVSGTATNNADYTLSAGMVSIPAGQTSITIPVPTIQDAIYEGDETVVLTLANPQGATLGTIATHTVTIIDDDPVPTLTFTSAASATDEGNHVVSVALTLSNPSAFSSSFRFTVGGTAVAGTNFSVSPCVITIPALATTSSIPVTIKEEAIREGDTAVVLTLVDPKGLNLCKVPAHTLTIRDNDAVAVASVKICGLTATYDGQPHGVTVTTVPANLAVQVAYNQVAALPIAAGTYAVTATVLDPRYTGSATATLTIAKATPIITWQTPAAMTYGTALSLTQLNATASTVGSFTYAPTLGVVLPAGNQTLCANFVPTDAANYTSAAASVTLLVRKAVPVLTWAAPTPIIYGMALSPVQLSAMASTVGTLVYSPSLGAVLDAGQRTLSVSFAPTDSANFTCATATVVLEVKKAVPVLTWATPAAIAYGQALSSVQLSATSSIAGLFTYVPAAGTVLSAGDHALTVDFTPTCSANFTSARASVTLTVGKVAPVLTWPAPASIIYGQALGAQQLNASASVAGNFTYTPAAGTILSVGAHTLNAAFAPLDSAQYNLATISVSLEVLPATPVVTWPAPAAITYGTALSSMQLNATASTAGVFTYLPDSGAILAAGTHTLSLQFAPNDTVNFKVVSASVSLQVLKATPQLVWAQPAPISYGVALFAVQLNATALTSGTITYTPAAGSVLSAGNQTLSAAFIPADANNYTNATASVELMVRKVAPVITWPAPEAITYGTVLSATQLCATASVQGSFIYLPTSGTLLTAGSHALAVTFTPVDQNNYENVSATTSLAVQKATPIITWSAPAAITHGIGLSAVQLNATASTAGSFVYTPTAETILSTGNHVLSTVFTPTDVANFTTASATAPLQVLESATVVTWLPPAAITYGTALSSVQLNATASVPGTFTYAPAAGTVLNAGEQVLSVSFAPNDQSSITVTRTVPLTVLKATPTITWATPAPSIYGTPLSSVQLNATASVPGSLVYTPTAGTVLSVGNQILSVTLTPSDALNYTTASSTVVLLVKPATPVVTWATPAPVMYGTELSSTQLNASSSTAGIFTYTPAAGVILPVGRQLLSTTFVPLETSNYVSVTSTVELVVQPATATLTWANPAAIVYGMALSATQLNATASLQGTLIYSPELGAVLPAGVRTLTVNFTPTDTANVTGATASVLLEIQRATPVVTWQIPAAITYGTALSVTQLNATASTAGTFTYVSQAGTVLSAGAHTLEVTFAPADAANFTTVSASVPLDVRQATPAVTWATPTAITYGTALGDDQLNAIASTAGTWIYAPARGTILNAGSSVLSVQFRPTDVVNWTEATASVTLVVHPATPVVTWATPAAITYGTALSSIQLNAAASVTGTFTYTPAVGAILETGAHTLMVNFAPVESANFTTATASVDLRVNPAVPTIAWSTPAPITYGTALSATQLNATASTSGQFIYTPAAGTMLSAGNQTLTVSFTPVDTVNFITSTAQVVLAVQQATPIIAWTHPAAITYGTSLGSNQLNATSSTAGTFTYTPAADIILPAGLQTLSVNLVPSDSVNFTVVSASVPLTVMKATSLITWTAPADLVYGTALSDVQLNATASTTGSFTYSPSAGTVLPVGSHGLSVNFIPSDADNYTTAQAAVTVRVQASVATIQWAPPAAIIYGTALSDLQLNASALQPGTFAYLPVAGTVLNAGSQTLSVVFTPTDLNIPSATASVPLLVQQATPPINWPTPAPITYGAALSAVQLNASVPIAGNLVYTPALGAVLSAGPQTLTVAFTPIDTVNYTNASATTILQIQPAIPVLTWSDPAPITYGTDLSSVQLNATASTAGTFVYTPAAGTILSAGERTLSVVFTPLASANFTTATAVVHLQVRQAAPAVTWPVPAPITFGSALSASQLNATCPIAGTLTYTPAAGAVLSVGDQSLAVAFQPTDAMNYTAAQASVLLRVNPATPTLTWLAPAPIAYGTALSSIQLSALANVAGTFIYTPAAGAVLPIGSHPLSVTFTPTDTNYTSATAAVVQRVLPGAVSLTWNDPDPIVYGTPLSDRQLNAICDTPGSLVYEPAAGAILPAGINTLKVTWHPADQNAFQPLSVLVSLTVTKRAPVLTWTPPADAPYGTPLSATQLSAQATVPGIFHYELSLGTILNVGSNILRARFVPNDVVNYISDLPVETTWTITDLAAADPKVQPLVEGVQDNLDGTFTIFYGFQNTNTRTVGVPIGPTTNYVRPGADNQGQPVLFPLGRSGLWPDCAFSVVAPSSGATWYLTRNLLGGVGSGTPRASAGSSSSPRVPIDGGTLPPNQAPVARITVPTTGSILVSNGSPVTVTVDAYDLDGAVTMVQLRDGATLLDSKAPTGKAQTSFSISNLTPGSHLLTAVVTDDTGLSGTSLVCTITVRAAPVLAFARTGTNLLVEGGSVGLTATASDSDGTITKVEFSKNGTVDSTQTTAPFAWTVSGLVAPVVVFGAKATDNDLLTASQSLVQLVYIPPVVLMTYPVSSQMVQPQGGIITLVAAASDPDGTVANVQFSVDGTPVGQATSSPYRYQWTVPRGQSSATVIATATDATGLITSTAPVTFAINQGPAVTVTSPQSGAVLQIGAALTVQATASDSDGAVNSMLLLKDGTPVAQAVGGTLSAPLVTDTAGSFTLVVQAYDTQGGITSSAPIQVRINSVPVVQLTAPVSGAVFNPGGTTVLAATASDSDSAITKVEFYVDMVLLSSDNTAPYQVSWDIGSAGFHTIEARAYDADGAISKSSVNVTVNAAPALTWITPANNAIIAVDQNVPLLVTVTDSDGTITNVVLKDGTTTLATLTTAPYAFTMSALTAGHHVLSATATDNRGAATTKTVEFDADSLPVVALTAPATGTVLTAPAFLTLSATASDSDGSISSVAFYTGATLLGTATASPYQVTSTAIAAGTYALTAVATDNVGSKTTSSPVSVILNAPPNLVFTAPAAATVIGKDKVTTLIATATDSDGTISSVAFKNGTTVLGIDTSAPYSISTSFATEGAVILTAEATDNHGAITSVQLAITVARAPIVTLTAPTEPAAIAPATTQTLTATASDPGGSIVSVTFFDGATVISTVTSAPYQTTWSSTVLGPHQITAVATNILGAQSTTMPVVLTISNLPQVAIIQPGDGQVYDEPATAITLTAQAVDLDNGIARVQFLEGTTVLGTATTTPYQLTLATLAQGAHVLTAKAFDSVGGMTLSAPITLRVNGRPTITLTAPATGSVLTIGEAFTATVNAFDREGIAQVNLLAGTSIIAQATQAPWNLAPIVAGTSGTATLTAQVVDSDGLATLSAPVQVTYNRRPTCAIALATPDAPYDPATGMGLVATAADSDGTVAKVTFYDGTTVIGEDTSAPYILQWFGATPTPHVLKAVATDNVGAPSQSGTLTVTVNALPLVTLTVPINGAVFQAPANVTLTATASDSDGTIATVVFKRGTTVLGTATTSPATLVLSNLASGTYTVTATATDNSNGVQTSSPITFTVAGGPSVALTAPLANASVTAGTSVSLAATASVPGGSISQVKFYDGANLIGQHFTAPFVGSWIATESGTHTLTAQAISDVGLTATSLPITVTVNVPPTVVVSATFASPNVVLNATAADSDGSITQVRFLANGAALNIDTDSPFTYSWLNPVVGTYNVVAEATDNLGAVISSTPLVVVINSQASIPPTVALTAPIDDTRFLTGAAITLTATAAPGTSGGVPIGTVARVEFYDGATKIGEDLTSPYSFVWNGATSGRHGVAAVAFSDDGSSTVSTQVMITVNALPTVVLTAPGADSVVTVGASLTLTADATDSDGVITAVDFLDGTTVLGSATGIPYRLVLPSGLAAGSRSLSVRATDDLGGVTTSAAVSAISNQGPVVALTAPTAGVKPNNTDVVLTATASDADGTIASVQFLANDQPVNAPVTAAPFQTTFVKPPSGNYALTARATDNRGAVTVSTSVAIQVDAAPTVTITVPATGTRVVTGSSLAISALAGDVDGTVTSVTFLVDGATVSTSTTFPYTATWTATSGTHSLTAIATDDLGRTTTSAAVSVIGNASPTVAITAPAANTTVASGQTIILTATASDDGSIANVAFFDGSARLALLSTAPYTYSWTGASPRTHDLTAVATDNYGAITTSGAVALTVTDSNQPPVVALTKPTSATVVYAGDTVAFAATASDPDGVITAVEWTIDGTVVASTTMSPYVATGTMPVTTGTHVIVARATDDRGRRSLSPGLTVTAMPLSSKPVITLLSPLPGEVVKITDGIWFSATASVAGSTISKIDFFGNGQVVGSDSTTPYSASWSPLAVGPVTVSATATDATGGQASSSPINVTVVSGDLQVLITSPSANGIVPTNAPTTIVAQVINGIAVSRVEFFVDGVSVGSDTTAPYQFVWTPSAVADVVLTAKVFDYGQSKISARVTVLVRADNGIGPTVAFSKPSANYGILGTDGVIGSVTVGSPAATVASWTLTLAPIGSGDYREIARGTTGAVAAALDTSLLSNGAYLLTLTGTDSLGRSKVATRPFLVEDQYKPGQFSFTVQDLVTPVSGIPLAVNRTYNSLNRDRVGDFGYGWSASFTDIEVKHDEQRIDTVDTSFNPISVRNGAGGRDVTITLPDGNRTTFQFDLAPGANFHQQAYFRSAPGTTATLSVYPASAGDLIVLFPPAKPYWAGTYGWTDSPWEFYDFPGYLLTLEDGTKYFLKREDLGDHTAVIGSAYVHMHYYGNTYLNRIEQPDGNQILINPSGIRHQDPSGQPTRRVVYQRDSESRITAVFDSLSQDASGNPSGLATVQYAYSPGGDLISVKKLVDRSKPAAQAYETSQYFYEDARFPHYLTKIVDPNGQPALRCEYDANGRLVATVDAAGHRVTVQNDIAQRTTTVIDRNGKPTVLGFDAQGRPVRTTDALGNTTYRTYDGRGVLLTETDALGHMTTYTNDALGHRLSETDALGNIARWTYDGKGNVLTSTDKNGRVTTNEYNGAGSLTKMTDALGKVTSYAYGANNQLASETDALGRVTQYGYDGSNNLTQITDAAGNITTFAYDSAGNQIRQQSTRTRADGIRETLVTQTAYDAQKRVVQVTNPDGTTTSTRYSLQGKPSYVIDALGRVTGFEYSATGQLLTVNYPDGSQEKSTFDGEGRVLTRVDRGGRLTTYAYDAVGRMVTVLLPDGASTATAYDAAGRVTTTTDERGNQTGFAYDVVNRRTGVTNALGQATTFAYDKVGNQTIVTDALSRSTQFTYDAVDRRTMTTYPNNSTTVTGYDAVGQRLTEQDQAGQVTTFGYDLLGRLTSVTDALGKVTNYGYDEVGNQTAQVDAVGRTTRYSYDPMGRRLTRTLPAGQQESMAYDAVGNVLRATDFRGYATNFTYDAGNRRLTKTFDGRLSQAVVTWTYSVDGRRTSMVDARGTTTYHYDGRGRLQDQETPRGTVFYAYDARGNLARLWTDHTGGANTSYGYDELNRLSTVIDTVAGVVNYGYDLVGNQATVALPNGVTSTYGYDTLNRLLTVTRKQGAATQATYTYTLDAVGRRTKNVESGGRTANWTYDVLSRLTSEAVTGGTTPGTIGYQFDNVGNRQVRTSNVTAVPATVTGYTPNDGLTSDTYDANGNTVSSVNGTDGYDAENHLTTRALPNSGGTVMIAYDGDGNKVTESSGGVVTSFLVSGLNPTGYTQTIEEFQGGAISRAYVWGNGLAPLAQRGGTVISYPVTDGQGSVRALTNAAGAVTDTFTYDAYGILIGRTGTTANRYLYCGYEYCEPLGQYYLRARYYDQGKGRFWTMDSWQGRQRVPASLHKYAYAHADPVNGKDPSGYMNIVELLGAISFSDTMRGAQGMTQAQIRKQVVNQILDIMKDQAADAIMEGVYMLAFGPAGEFLYVGETNDMERRIDEHENSGTKWQKRARKAGTYVADELTPRIVGFLKLSPIPDLEPRTNKFIRNVVETMILESVNESGGQTLNENSSVARDGTAARNRLGRHAGKMSPALRKQFTEFFNLLGR